jgi:hypothetical protein
MTEQKNDGGPAFPFIWYDTNSIGDIVPRESFAGMSLRDWFAGQALLGFFSSLNFHGDLFEKYKKSESWDKKIALLSYEVADAMLKEREK